MNRTATIERQTRETEIALTLALDGQGSGEIATSVPFMDHMLILLARHGFLDLRLVFLGGGRPAAVRRK